MLAWRHKMRQGAATYARCDGAHVCGIDVKLSLSFGIVLVVW